MVKLRFIAVPFVEMYFLMISYFYILLYFIVHLMIKVKYCLGLYDSISIPVPLFIQ